MDAQSLILTLSLLMPALFLYIFLYMLGILWNKEGMKSSAKEELWEWGVNVVLLLFFYFIFFYPSDAESVVAVVYNASITYLLDNTGWSYTGYDASLAPWKNLILYYENSLPPLEEALTKLHVAYRDVREMSSATISLSLFTSSFSSSGGVKTATSTSVRPCQSYSLISRVLANIYNQIVTFYKGFLNLQKFVAQMSSPGAVLLYLIVGFFFRSFRITRGIGGFLIALSITTMFVLPFSYILMEGIFAHYWGKPSAVYVKEGVDALLSSPHLPHPSCRITTLPSTVADNIKGFYEEYNRPEVVVAGYAILVTFAFSWLLYFSALLGIMGIMGTQISPYVLNILLRV